eukprot:2951927-Pleurochrysis_carterae.AAC.1
MSIASPGAAAVEATAPSAVPSAAATKPTPRVKLLTYLVKRRFRTPPRSNKLLRALRTKAWWS